MFQPDARLKDNPLTIGANDNIPVSDRPSPTIASLPLGFPSEIPIYPNAKFVPTNAAATPTGETSGTSTSGNGGFASNVFRWVSPDTADRVQSFYRKQFQINPWQIVRQPNDDLRGTFEAQRNGLKVIVSIQPVALNPNLSASPSDAEFTIRYVRDETVISQTDSVPTGTPSPTVSPSPNATNSDFIGPVQPGEATPTVTSSAFIPTIAGSVSDNFTDLGKVPQALRPAVADVAKLGVLSVKPSATKTTTHGNLLEPNKAITRREFARWLVAANNRIYANRPAQQIRPGTETAQPAFQDVPRSDPDFPAIQGLAEAGLLPSPLSGDSTTVLFRPDIPLTRENLVLWKVPIDNRQGLPNATIEAVKETWGFQDAAKILPRALKAILADYQNGDLSNIRRVFGYTTLFQPKKSVSRAEAAATLWYFGIQGEGLSAQDALKVNSGG
ncbi:MAG: S-layer homology domain-containing protein [Scytolyngbya sp. HA4215-MV1]|jgi:hypothetical protein|nr:S-layer homology domain-containing protein [Scytolyngbya sp. HA4215-MV1]